MKSPKQSDCWATPDALVRRIGDVLGCRFDLDVCASQGTNKAPRWFDDVDDGLAQEWSGTCWMNPPHSDPKPWCGKAWEESLAGRATVVGLLPVSTDAHWWQHYVMEASEVYFLDRRIRFVGAKYNLPRPCAVVVWRAHSLHPVRFETMHLEPHHARAPQEEADR